MVHNPSERLMIELYEYPKSLKLSYADAELLSWTCTHNNKYDWRLPTKWDDIPFIMQVECWNPTGSPYEFEYRKFRPVVLVR
jgi:hypothetical protein